MRFLLVGDLHLGKMDSVMKDGNGLRRQLACLRRQIEIAKSRGVHHGVLLGDIYDTPFPSQRLMLSLVKELHESRMEWLCYTGNHDTDSAHHTSLSLIQELPQYGALKNVTFVTSPRLIKWGDLRAYVMPWRKDYDPVRRDCDVIFFHDSVSGFRHDNGMPIRQDEGVPKNFFRGQLAVSGHLHTPQRTGNIWYPGTGAQLSFGEHPRKMLFFGEKLRSGVRITGKPFEPPWTLRKVKYDAHEPPTCDAPNTYYSLDISADKPGPKWMSENPNVVKTTGASSKVQKELTEKVAEIVGGKSDQSDTDLLRRWLKRHSGLAKPEIREALKIDASL